MKRTFIVGEYVEEMPWEVEDDVVQEARWTRRVCPHAVKTLNGDWCIPCVIRAYNEGGFNYTELCAACVLAAILPETFGGK